MLFKHKWVEGTCKWVLTLFNLVLGSTCPCLRPTVYGLLCASLSFTLLSCHNVISFIFITECPGQLARILTNSRILNLTTGQNSCDPNLGMFVTMPLVGHVSSNFFPIVTTSWYLKLLSMIDLSSLFFN